MIGFCSAATAPSRAARRASSFLLHPVESVRNFAGDYFYNRHYQPPDLVDQVFKGVNPSVTRPSRAALLEGILLETRAPPGSAPAPLAFPPSSQTPGNRFPAGGSVFGGRWVNSEAAPTTPEERWPGAGCARGMDALELPGSPQPHPGARGAGDRLRAERHPPPPGNIIPRPAG